MPEPVPASFTDDTRALLRERLLTAAEELLEQQPWSRVTMAAVAARAGVSRQTFYNELGSRAALAEALSLREVDRLLVGAEAALTAGRADPAAALAAAFAGFLDAAAASPVVRALLSEEDAGSLLPLITLRGGPLLARATGGLATVVGGLWPEVDPAAGERLAELVVRLALSYLTMPPSDPAAAAEGLATLLRPYVAEVVGGRPPGSTAG